MTNDDLLAALAAPSPAGFRVYIATDSAAFGDDPDSCAAELARILRALAARLSNTAFPESIGPFLRLYDVNGNSVGAAEWSAP